jgi:triacylglycerol lipase
MNANDVYTRLRALGRDFTPAQILATREILAPLVSRPAGKHLVGRDLHYGPDARQRLDLFVPPRASATLVFMHGGGFVQGDKGGADAPFYNNVAAWALAQGFAAVNMTYRLAPLHPWPTGAQELALVLDWLADELPRHGVRRGSRGRVPRRPRPASVALARYRRRRAGLRHLRYRARRPE